MTQESPQTSKRDSNPKLVPKNAPKTPVTPLVGEEEEITEIVPGLYISGFSHAKDLDTLQRIGIRFVLSTASEVSENNFLSTNKEIVHKRLNIKDEDEEFLIRFFDETNQFIEKALKSHQKILVHCMMGLSRSVSVIAAFLIHSQKVSDALALKRIEEKRGMISPNEGFKKQLKLYSLMGGSLTGSSRYHRIYQIGLLKSRRDNSQLTKLLPPKPSQTNQETQFSCANCSNYLFNKGNEYHHEPFDTSKVVPDDSCNFHYVEPLSWMAATGSEEIVMENKGGIYCPECDEQLGEWNWRGSACPDCHTFVVPSFRISKNCIKSVQPDCREIISS